MGGSRGGPEGHWPHPPLFLEFSRRTASLADFLPIDDFLPSPDRRFAPDRRFLIDDRRSIADFFPSTISSNPPDRRSSPTRPDRRFLPIPPDRRSSFTRPDRRFFLIDCKYPSPESTSFFLIDCKYPSRRVPSPPPGPPQLLNKTEKVIRRNGESATTRLDRMMSNALNAITSEVDKALFPGGLQKPFPNNCLSLMTAATAKGGLVNVFHFFNLVSSHVVELQKAFQANK
ncbi:hypothetical protein KSP40_PGU006970 [Platanthera guangdongensis]|uniref:DNA-directed RNA polymerase n=1 Tax=Platanthera guangdongensis TaxID=2320717 RepID=A0ABR2MGK0_9ASPA